MRPHWKDRNAWKKKKCFLCTVRSRQSSIFIGPCLKVWCCHTPALFDRHLHSEIMDLHAPVYRSRLCLKWVSYCSGSRNRLLQLCCTERGIVTQEQNGSLCCTAVCLLKSLKMGQSLPNHDFNHSECSRSEKQCYINVKAIDKDNYYRPLKHHDNFSLWKSAQANQTSINNLKIDLYACSLQTQRNENI